MGTYRLLTARPAPEAYVMLGALRAEGLRVRLEHDGLGAVYGMTRGQFATRVVVDVEDYDQAAALLAEIERTSTESRETTQRDGGQP